VISKKVCMLGSFGVGKTSLVARSVRGIFDESYLSTVGVKIDKKLLDTGDRRVLLMLWDIAGDDPFQNMRAAYLKGAAGFFFVVDGTRRETAEVAWKLKELADASVGPVPARLLLNKADLKREWELDEATLQRFTDAGVEVLETSAKDGANVELAFSGLSAEMAGA
jgi:small GTP-binding protein